MKCFFVPQWQRERKGAKTSNYLLLSCFRHEKAGTKNLTKSRVLAGLCLTGDKKAITLDVAKNETLIETKKFEL